MHFFDKEIRPPVDTNAAPGPCVDRILILRSLYLSHDQDNDKSNPINAHRVNKYRAVGIPASQLLDMNDG